jgi:thiaminase/transcriptional activator TenA
MRAPKTAGGREVSARRAGFTGELWDSAGGIYAAILDHPFLAGLTSGTLPEDRFRHYIVQDSLYLEDYARVLSLAAARAPDEGAVAMFDEHAAGAIAVERSLHEGFLKQLGVSTEDLERATMAPTTLAYTSYLLRTAALGDYYEVLGSLLPCYWIYHEIGGKLLEGGSPHPLYGTWIQTYAGEEFGALVEAVLGLTDETCHGLDPGRKALAIEAFRTSSRYEWMFWEMAWTLESWPVG